MQKAERPWPKGNRCHLHSKRAPGKGGLGLQLLGAEGERAQSCSQHAEGPPGDLPAPPPTPPTSVPARQVARWLLPMGKTQIQNSLWLTLVLLSPAGLLYRNLLFPTEADGLIG